MMGVQWCFSTVIIMSQTAIPFVFMRGGTSRGPYFHKDDLPVDRDVLADVLISVLGAGHPFNIDGVGGGTAVTTKVAILSKSQDDWPDVDFFFAQVSVDEKRVDFKPTCGNILSAVGPAAIEMGLVKPDGDVTDIKIAAVNTGVRVVASVQTRDGQPNYDGTAEIAGVPGQSAPVALQFMDIVGATTGYFLPTGNLRDVVDGVEVTCMDVAMPMVMARAADFGLAGDETVAQLNENGDLLARIERTRIKAGALMGMGDVSQSVTPKFGLIAPARKGGTLAVRYFMPWNAHPSMAVTGAQCLASCALTAGTVSDGLLNRPEASPARVVLEHASGKIELMVTFSSENGFSPKSVGVVRTARKLANGQVYVPRTVWGGEKFQ